LEFRYKRNEKLEIVQFERVAFAGGRKGGLGGIPPALQIFGEICSNFFERTPPSFTFSEIEGTNILYAE